MSEDRYLLSPIFSLPAAEDILKDTGMGRDETEDIRRIKAKEAFFLANDGKNKLFVINPTIHAFLSAFQSDATLGEVITRFAKEVGCEEEQIKPVMRQFFEDMRRRGILISQAAREDMHRIQGHLREMDKRGTVEATLKNYEIEEVISSKNLVEIYRATRKSDGKRVVIKSIVLSEAMGDKRKAKFKKKFGHEFQLMRDIGDHPNVCGFYEYREFDNCAWAAIEHIEGVSVRKFVSGGGRRVEDKESIIRQIVSAIAHVQSRDILHGDIHNSNFLITPDMGVKLIDFDLANREQPEEGEVLRNGGVYSFIPPERISLNSFSFLKKTSDTRSEVFQLGVISYYVLYGEMPFSGFTWPQLANEILTKTPEFPVVTNEGQNISGIILDSLKIAMRKDPSERFADARALSHSIRPASVLDG